MLWIRIGFKISMRIRIQLFASMRIRLKGAKQMRNYVDPGYDKTSPSQKLYFYMKNIPYILVCNR